MFINYSETFYYENNYKYKIENGFGYIFTLTLLDTKFLLTVINKWKLINSNKVSKNGTKSNKLLTT